MATDDFISRAQSLMGNAQSPSPSPGMAGFADRAKQAMDTVKPADMPSGAGVSGSSPMNAIDESPLSLMERAQLGWVRTPDEQMKLLRGHFDNVAQVPDPSGKSSMITVEKDGKWFQVDPSFEWKFSIPGAVAGGLAGITAGPAGMALGAAAGGVAIPTLSNKKNLSNIAGTFAQSTGEYGLRAAAAGAAGEAGMAAGMAAGAPLGPLGVAAGGAIGGITAAALGSAGADATDLAARQATMDPSTPGASPYKDADEINKQMMASAMFGAESFVGGKAIQFGADKVAKTFGKIISGYRDTPDGHEAARKLLGLLGAKPEEIEARLQNPMQNAAYDAMRAADVRDSNPLQMGRLDKAQEYASDELHDAVTGLVRKQGAEFKALENDPKVKSTSFDLSNAFNDAKQALMDNQFISEDGSVHPLRELREGDKSALNFILRKRPMEVGYKDARAYIQDAQAILDGGVTNNNLYRTIVQLKDGANQEIVNGLEDKTSISYGDIMKKYAEAKSLKESLDTVTSGNKRFAVGQKLLSDNPNETKATMDSLSKAGVDPNLLLKFVQMQGSRNSDAWFTNKKFPFKVMGTDIPNPGPRFAAQAITAGAQARSMVGQAGQGAASSDTASKIAPYMDKTVRMMRQMAPQQLRSALMNPNVLDTITGIIGGSAASEEQHKNDLLQGIQ